MIDIFNSELLKLLIHPVNKLSKNFVIGLSGGVDSMVLLYLIKRFLDQNKFMKINIFPIIIDHNLRVESSTEAENVKSISEGIGFRTIIKKIEKQKPSGNIQSWARENRRDLLFESCSDLSANLLLAHHLNDQAETLYMRFNKNSGLDGLLGMKTITFWNGIFILRPLLTFSKEEIVRYAQKNNIKFFEDPSNSFLKYERVRVRQKLIQIKRNKWENVSTDLNKFSIICNKLVTKTNLLFENWLEQHVLLDKCGVVRVNYKSALTLFKQSDLYCIKFFSKIIQTVGGKKYSPKRKQVYELTKALLKNDFKKRTLGNVCVLYNKDHIFFIREKRHLNYNLDIKVNKKYIFDGRFILISNVPGKLICSEKINYNNIPPNSPFYEFKNLINKTIPCLQTLEGKLVKPHLNIINQKNNSNESIKSNSFGLYLINRVLI
jgi:tRNA(Ile)-lysidine synthase